MIAGQTDSLQGLEALRAKFMPYQVFREVLRLCPIETDDAALRRFILSVGQQQHPPASRLDHKEKICRRIADNHKIFWR